MKKYTRVKWGCYTVNIAMSAVIITPALLFATFQRMYNISFALLGLLVLINFVSQLIIDLIFSFYSHKFNIPMTVKSIPFILSFGFVVYALCPMFFPNMAYLGLVIGTVIFSSACGLAEVLVSPVIAAIPSDNPEKEMSNLHAMYAWGVIGVTVFSTIMLYFLKDNWQVLMFLLLVIPLSSVFLFSKAELPPMQTPEAASHVLKLFKNKSMLFCFAVIFFGGASENTIAQWSSNYLEQALHMPKMWGDMLGVALFAAMLGIGRAMYAKNGKNIVKTMLIGAFGASICYAVLVFVNVPVVGLLACAFSGYCVAMLWPGSLLLVQEKVPAGGVAIFALMAAGGDVGSAIAPQLVGFVTDMAILSEPITKFGAEHGYTVEQIGMKCGFLVGLLFPVIATILLAFGYKKQKVQSKIIANIR